MKMKKCGGAVEDKFTGLLNPIAGAVGQHCIFHWIFSMGCA